MECLLIKNKILHSTSTSLNIYCNLCRHHHHHYHHRRHSCYYSLTILLAMMIFALKSTTALLKPAQTTTRTMTCASLLNREIINKVSSSSNKSNRADRRTINNHHAHYRHNILRISSLIGRQLSSSYSSTSTTTTACQMTIADTSLGSEKGALLLDGLDIYTVPARDDGHPLTVYGIGNQEPKNDDHVLLMLHGRTWSSVPVYHLLGGPRNSATGNESRSLMEALRDKNICVYSMDFRGFGGTPSDETGSIEPNRCVEDVESVCHWLAERHHSCTPEKISLMGWSQGALVAQLAAQRSKPLFSRLILYGSIFDPLIRYPREPLYVRNKENATAYNNTFDAAIEDFTIEGTIPPKAATYFAEAALLADPSRVQWKHLYQFNNCDPARVHVPTLVVVGDQDPYAPIHVQQELFTNLARGNDRTWSILSDADHAVHLLEGRSRFTNIVSSFITNGKKIGKEILC